MAGILDAIGRALTGAISNASKQIKTKTPTKTQTKTPTKTVTSGNEHLDYINEVNPGGFDAYRETQQKKLDNAILNNDTDMLSRLNADMKRVGYSLTPTITMPQVSQVPQVQQSGFDQSGAMEDLLSMNKQMADANFQAQKAQLDAMLEQQLTDLKKSYDQAVADGEISVREAESQFEEQKKQIEQQAYQDAERTGLYSQEMGIQNSQQSIGLMQGDNARKNSMVNQNMTERDKRVSDIQTRLNNIKLQKNLDMTNATAQHGIGLLGAKAQSNQQMAQNAFGLMSNDYQANRDQGFTRDNMAFGNQLEMGKMEFGNQLDRGNMEIQQGYNQINMQTQFQNALASATHDSTLAIDRMNVQHGFDLEKMTKSLQDDLTKMSKQFGYSSSLNAQEQANRITMISKEYEAKVKQEQDTYERDLERNLRGVHPGTKEYELITGTAERELKQRVNELHTNTVYEAVSMDVFANTPSSEPSMPTNHKDKFGDVGNLLSGYEGKMNDYNAMMDAYNRRLQFMEDPYAFMNNK